MSEKGRQTCNEDTTDKVVIDLGRYYNNPEFDTLVTTTSSDHDDPFIKSMVENYLKNNLAEVLIQDLPETYPTNRLYFPEISINKEVNNFDSDSTLTKSVTMKSNRFKIEKIVNYLKSFSGRSDGVIDFQHNLELSSDDIVLKFNIKNLSYSIDLSNLMMNSLENQSVEFIVDYILSNVKESLTAYLENLFTPEETKL